MEKHISLIREARYMLRLLEEQLSAKRNVAPTLKALREVLNELESGS